MGQQETVAGSVLRRIVLALLVAALMAAMMVVMAMPALAKNSGPSTPHNSSTSGPPVESFGSAEDSSSVLHCDGAQVTTGNGAVHGKQGACS